MNGGVVYVCMTLSLSRVRERGGVASYDVGEVVLNTNGTHFYDCMVDPFVKTRFWRKIVNR